MPEDGEIGDVGLEIVQFVLAERLRSHRQFLDLVQIEEGLLQEAVLVLAYSHFDAINHLAFRNDIGKLTPMSDNGGGGSAKQSFEPRVATNRVFGFQRVEGIRARRRPLLPSRQCPAVDTLRAANLQL